MENIFIEESSSDFIPLLSQDEDDNIINETNSLKKNNNKYINILYVRNMVLFPFVVTTITISNNILIELLHKIYYSNKSDKIVGILTQKNKIENPTEKDLYTIGTVSKILKLLKLPNGNITVIIKGIYRFKIKKIIYNKTYLKAEIIPLCEEK
ncbi:MAG: LON peptidase substrate-binding domain-containing protein, partial [Flavobacteriia bacterium]|nr:LON peptidase substrate-binding domain-containing protein [Candidatus Bostrichicola ureolyticus]